MTIEFSYPVWYVLICILMGLLYSFVFYRKEKLFKEVNKALVYAMGFLRFTSVFILTLLLLEPLIEIENQIIEKPVLVIAHDNSESLLVNKDSAFINSDYLISLTSFKEKLEEKYEVKTFTFGDEVQPGLEIDFTDKETGFSDLLNELYTRYYGRNLGAVILASDGIVNKGSSPIYDIKKIKHTPFFTIALGDTLERKDLILNNIVHNRLAYKGNDFPVEIVVKANQFAGSKAKVSIAKDGVELFSEMVFFEKSSDIITLSAILEAKSTGKQRYVVNIGELAGELTYENNKREFYIDILDNKQQILILAKAPHPDIAAMQSALEKNVNYEVKSMLVSEYEGEGKGYSLVIFHQLPSGNKQQNLLVEKIIKIGVPSLFVLGSGTNYTCFNEYNLGLELIGVNGVTNVTASVNKTFSQFKISESLKEATPKFPPLKTPFAGNYKVANSSSVLLHQKIGVTATDYPLLVFNEKNDSKYGFIIGEGIWRWKLNDYSNNKSHDNFNDLVSKMIQYLALKEDKSKFRIYCENTFLENQSVVFESELYNDSYELVNEEEVLIEITNQAGEVYPAKSFSRSGNAYRLDAGVFEVGEYSYNATVMFGGKKLDESGEFTVTELKAEYTNVVADHSLLFNMANSTGGNMFYPNELNKLAKAIFNKEEIVDVSYIEKDVSAVINWKWIFALMMFLLSLEWFLRKRNGAY